MDLEKLNIKLNKKIVFAALAIAVFLYPLAATLADCFRDRIPYGISAEILLDIGSNEDTYPVGELMDGCVVRQGFMVNTSNLIAGIKLQGATYMRTNQGTLAIHLLEEGSPQKLYTWEEDVSEMEDNQYITLNFEGAGYDLSGKKCVIEIISKGGEPGNAVTFYACQDNVYPNGHLWVDGKKQPGDLCFQVLQATRKSFLNTKIWLRVYAAVAWEAFLYILYAKCGNGKREGKR